MAIVTLSEILADAHKKKYAVGMFDVFNLEMTKAVIEAAEEEKSPVIVALAEASVTSKRDLGDLADIINNLSAKSSIPICTHFDHGGNVDSCIFIIQKRFSSVMFDGSALPYEENIEKTKEVVRYASAAGTSLATCSTASTTSAFGVSTA